MTSRQTKNAVASAPSLEAVRRRGYSVGLRNDAQRALSERLRVAAESSLHHADIEDLLAALSYDPETLTSENKRDIRLISAPVFNPAGEVELALTLHDFPKPDEVTGIEDYIAEVVKSAEEVTSCLDRRPAPST
jgi:DNA-binding IclR family transcriptional regulator